MGFTVWLCALCLQASLLLHALDCSTAAAAAVAPSVSRRTADVQVRDGTWSLQVDSGRAKVFIRRATVITFAAVTLSGASTSPF